MTDHYAKINQDLYRLAVEIEVYCKDEGLLANNVGNVAGCLKNFSNELTKRLTLDDKSIYLDLLKSKDYTIMKSTQEYIREMSKIMNILNIYVRTYSSEYNIMIRTSDFITQTHDIVKYLAGHGKEVQSNFEQNHPLYH